MKKLVKIIKDVQSYENGNCYRIHESFANTLIRLGKAEEVKEEKTVIETKEEKHAPAETKEVKPEKKEEEQLSIKKLSDVISTYSEDELLSIIKNDIRVSAKRLAEGELRKRG